MSKHDDGARSLQQLGAMELSSLLIAPAVIDKSEVGSGKHLVPIILVLNEDVTPDFLVERVVLACVKFGALRDGEGVVIPGSPREMLGAVPRVVRPTCEMCRGEETDRDLVFEYQDADDRRHQLHADCAQLHARRNNTVMRDENGAPCFTDRGEPIPA